MVDRIDRRRFAFLLCLPPGRARAADRGAEEWIPMRWPDGREWYEPAALALLEGSPINCLLVSGRGPKDAEGFAREARNRGLTVVQQAGEAVRVAEGVWPSSRNLSEMGIRSAPSSEPWIESNIWLVRWLRSEEPRRPVWISYQPEKGSAADYARYVADAAVAGARWMVAPDAGLRAGLLRRDAAALETWRRIGSYLRFAEGHAGWREFAPFGNLAIVFDSQAELAAEYLKLAARRQAPYRIVARARLAAGALAGARAVLATDLASPTAAERGVLRGFAEQGGVLIAGPWWGGAAKDEAYTEIPLGKGRVVVYRDPEPESVARDLRNVLTDEETGVVAFNVPTAITYAGAADGGKRLLIQLLNYSDSPARDITIRVAGDFRSARLVTPEGGSENLAPQRSAGQVEIKIPRLGLWGGVLVE